MFIYIYDIAFSIDNFTPNITFSVINISTIARTFVCVIDLQCNTDFALFPIDSFTVRALLKIGGVWFRDKTNIDMLCTVHGLFNVASDL